MRGLCRLATLMLVLTASPAMAQKLAILGLDLRQDTASRIAKAAEVAALDKGWEVEVQDAAGDLAGETQRLQALVEAGTEGILLVASPVGELETPLSAAKGAGIPVVSVMSGLSPFTAFDITVNEFEVGAKVGVYLLGAMEHAGNLLMARAESRPPTRIRGRVMDLIRAEYPEVKLVAAQDLDPATTPPDALRARLEAWLKQHAAGAKAVWTATEQQAFMTDDILRTQGRTRGQLLLTTVDGGQEAFRRLRDPESLLTATVVIPYEVMGETGVDTLEDLLAGTAREKITAGAQLFVDTILVDTTNVPPEDSWPW